MNTDKETAFIEISKPLVYKVFYEMLSDYELADVETDNEWSKVTIAEIYGAMQYVNKFIEKIDGEDTSSPN